MNWSGLRLTLAEIRSPKHINTPLSSQIHVVPIQSNRPIQFSEGRVHMGRVVVGSRGREKDMTGGVAKSDTNNRVHIPVTIVKDGESGVLRMVHMSKMLRPRGLP